MPESALLQKPYSSPPRARLPGAFDGDITLNMHTYQGWSLIYGARPDGRPNGTVGLFQFAGEIHRLWEKSGENDPFADWYLEQTQRAFTDATNTLCDMQSDLEAMIKTDALVFGMSESSAIVGVSLSFGNPYGYIGARLVVACDKAVRLAYSCKHTGLLTEEDAQGMVANAVRIARHAFLAHKKYKNRAVTREDAVQKNKRWNEAVDLMGEPPEDIVKGRRAAIAPRPKINVVPKEIDAVGSSPTLSASQVEDEVPREEYDDKIKDIATPESVKKPTRKKKSSV